MVVDADSAVARQALLARAGVLIVGPGLGQADWGRGLLQEAMARGLPTVLDADGLNGFAAMNLTPCGPVVVTPHAGEAARLLGCSTREVQSDRPGLALALARRVRGTAVLKGAGSLIATLPDDTSEKPVLLGMCAHGNPGMASAGMGDVLSGVIGGLLAQGLSPAAAAVSGTCLHSFAGDRAAQSIGERSLLATDLLATLMEILHEEERGQR
jgi:NAD(P)H-hydrate epimerase